ncbi:asparagine synthase (glutamine-hydrolyzing) [Rheinheimera texasensis]|uniref:asparagine synthase (glutamine-hydrolyzing) n=1 Tax=Rheinheimera texasensis TaxID=306205 RepID=UPI0032B2D1DB
MCGFIGFSRIDGIDNQQIAQQMCQKIVHRGPDSEGIWQTEGVPVVLGHRRLSIVDLSAAGHQPMLSATGRYVIAYNGEVYNHVQLREMLQAEGYAEQWRGHSDTETLLACIEAWGIVKTLQAAVGMFAFALWDQQARQLTLARDRMGEKPLYWGWQGDVLLFGSELKALKAHPAFKAGISRDALTLLLRHCYIPAPYSIYQGFYKLKPGHYLQLELDSPLRAKLAVEQAYWSFNQMVEQSQAAAITGTDTEATDQLEAMLTQSIRGQMLADVPLGAFLSGGVDSSSVVALMQMNSQRPVKTFTIGFNEAGFDEAICAKDVARHLQTDHTELYVSPQDALDVIPRLPSMYCEPFADSSQIPTFLVSQLARQHVTVALSGDGGDELFGGYNRHLAAGKVWGPFQKAPLFCRKAAAGLLNAVPPKRWDQLFELAKPLLPKKLHLAIPGEKARKLAEVLALPDGQQFYRRLTSHWHEPEKVVLAGHEPKTMLTDPALWPKTDSLEHFMMAMDAQTYMADDILTKVDRAAMATSLETRVPMLDHRLVEFAWQLPLHFKIRQGQGKWLLRQVLYRHVPKELIERPKMGFGIPLDQWLRGPLRDWAEQLLDSRLLDQQGYFRTETIRTMWLQHQSGSHNWQYHLWNVLMFQAWLAEQ